MRTALLRIPLLIGDDVYTKTVLNTPGRCGKTLLMVQTVNRPTEKNQPLTVLRPRINTVATINESLSVWHTNDLHPPIKN